MDRHYADLHLHTTASDGTLTPREVVELACGSGLSVIAITDHDTVSGIDEAREVLPLGLTLVPGVEFSCLYRGKESFLLHVLGYGIDTSHSEIERVVSLAREARLHKHSLRLGYLKDVYGIEFTEEEHEYLNTRPNVGRLHIARLLIDRGLSLTVRDAIDKFMSAPDFPDGTIPADLAIASIKAAGGIPTYAHSLGGECEVHLPFDVVAHRVKLLKGEGIEALECYYSRYSMSEIDFLLSLARDEGLLVSGGSDFHGKNKTVTIGTASDCGMRVSSEALTVLDKILHPT